jgi:hypothetical protein
VAASWSFTEYCYASPTGGALRSTNSFHSRRQLFANAPSRLAGRLFVYFRFEFLIRRSQLQILFLHNGRELVEIF